MKIDEFIAKFVDQDLPRIVQDLQLCRTVRQIAAWKKNLIQFVENEIVEGEDTLKAYDELQTVMGRLQTIQANLGKIIDGQGIDQRDSNPEKVLLLPETRHVTEVEPNIAYSEDSVPERVNVKSNFQSLTQGFVGFLTGKKEEIKQDIQEKLAFVPTRMAGQLNQSLTKVKTNFKQATIDISQIDVSEVVKSRIEKVPVIVNEKQAEIQQLILPVQDQIHSSAQKNIFQSMKLNTSQMVSKLQQKLPDKERVLSRMAQAGQKLKEDNPFKDLFKRTQQETSPVALGSEYTNEAQQKRKGKIVYVDRMAQVLDRLDSELLPEEEQKVAPQQSGSSIQQNIKDKAKQFTSYWNREKPLHQLWRKATSRDKNNEDEEEKQAASSDFAINRTQTAKFDTEVDTNSLGEQKQRIKRAKTSNYHQFPNRIVDGPEIMFFVPSWFQTNVKRRA